VQVSRARNALYRDGRLPYASHGFVDRDYTRDDRHPHALRAWAARRDVPFLDVTTILRRDPDAAFLDDDYHLSAAGHRAIATALELPVQASCTRAAPPAPTIAAPVTRAALTAAVSAPDARRTTAEEDP
jgi:lysophospholipase L1-like esterase